MRYIDHWIEAGFECAQPIKNSGAGAGMMRIEATRRLARDIVVRNTVMRKVDNSVLPKPPRAGSCRLFVSCCPAETARYRTVRFTLFGDRHLSGQDQEALFLRSIPFA
jgi:hypothetical protein